MPPRLTMQELEARRRRAQEGMERFDAAADRLDAEIDRRLREEGTLNMALGVDAPFKHLSKEVTEEMAAAVELMREGMPKTALPVGVLQHASWLERLVLMFVGTRIPSQHPPPNLPFLALFLYIFIGGDGFARIGRYLDVNGSSHRALPVL